MPSITGSRLRDMFLEFFQRNGHAILPSASLIPEGDPTVLFTTAGMQPLVPYLLGASHPLGKRLANAQKCLRTDDIEEVGDSHHLTFFEMLGNWSLGDYFKDDAIAMSFEFLTSDRWLGIPLEKLAVTCFAGDADAPRDETSAALWRTRGVPNERIFFFGKEENWWGPLGKAGPCGPDTEMFFDTGKPGRSPNDGTERFVEIWNDVFLEYRKTEADGYEELPQKNVDTGMGLERAVMTLNGLGSVYETDLIAPIVHVASGAMPTADTRGVRIIADHLRAATFVLADPRGIVPSNVDQGYILRRLIRRALRSLQTAGADADGIRRVLTDLPAAVATVYGDTYPEVRAYGGHVVTQFGKELHTYGEVVQRAEQIVAKRVASGVGAVTGPEAFAIYQEMGVHPDLLRSLGQERGLAVDLAGFDAEFERHREVSRAGVTQRFAGGLVNHDPRTVRLHTATHLLHEALRRVLGPHVQQKGSNITPERLRFDFSHPARLTAEELRKIEELVNAQVTRDLPVTRAELTVAEAKSAGALGFFEERYGDRVHVYAIGDFSKEICGGPHVSRTGEVGRVRIVKDEALASGIRRIRAVVED